MSCVIGVGFTVRRRVHACSNCRMLAANGEPTSAQHCNRIAPDHRRSPRAGL